MVCVSPYDWQFIEPTKFRLVKHNAQVIASNFTE